jgi:hypothetical protein
MLQHFILTDIIHYILNLYLDYIDTVPKLEKIINLSCGTQLNFDIKPHLSEERYNNWNGINEETKERYADT